MGLLETVTDLPRITVREFVGCDLTRHAIAEWLGKEFLRLAADAILAEDLPAVELHMNGATWYFAGLSINEQWYMLVEMTENKSVPQPTRYALVGDNPSDYSLSGLPCVTCELPETWSWDALDKVTAHHLRVFNELAGMLYGTPA